MILHLDIETFSCVDLGSAGVYRYAEDASTELTCLSYCFDDGEVKQWKPGDSFPDDFLEAWNDPAVQLHAHNAQFERVVLNGHAGQVLGLRRSKIERWTCTAAKAAACGLPRSLGDASKALGTHAKDDAGRIPMLQISKPRKPLKAEQKKYDEILAGDSEDAQAEAEAYWRTVARWTMENAPDKWTAMLAYNLDDVKAERDLDNALPDLDENEQRLYHLDQKINERGWKVDLEAVRNILFVVEEYKAQLAKQCEELTWDWLSESGLKPTQREKIADWLRAKGVMLQDMTADTIRQAVSRPGLAADVTSVLRIYSTYNAKSVSKLQAMLDAVCADGRLRGMFMFYGATTGRWSSLIVQLQNMMRPVIKDPNTAIEAFAARDIELIKMLYEGVDPMKVAGSCIRGCLVASDGMDLIYPDYSGIEDRVNLWFFDDEPWLNIYRAYDAKKGRHPYSITTCKLFGLKLETFSDEDPRRQIGKVVRLSMGYEGGVAAFATMAPNYNVDLAEMAKVVLPTLTDDALDHAAWMHKHHPTTAVETQDIETACNGIKYLYRQESPKIVQGWKDLKEAAEKAVEFEGEAFWLPNRKIAFKVEEYRGRKWLCMRLPSGRKVKYYDPKWTPPRESERWINNELVPYTIPGYMDYLGTDTYTRQWMRLQTYGGKLDENADQGFSRDILCNAMLGLDAAGVGIVGSEHDKVIMETDGGDLTVDQIKAMMLKQPAYCDGLPLATDGKRVKRYGK